eukprot:60623-Rhodomonas_salina.1
MPPVFPFHRKPQFDGQKRSTKHASAVSEFSGTDERSIDRVSERKGRRGRGGRFAPAVQQHCK